MAVPTRILSLCTGLGGLDLGIEIALRKARVVCAVERDAYCAAVLAQGMEQGHIHQAPIWDDLRTFDGRPWRGSVDCVTAGYPCQPFSVAGQKRGADDPRHLWPEVARIVDECRAPLVFLENVARHLTAGFDVVARDLQDMGYTVAAMVCRAATVGAPHRRERLFALAVSNAGRELCRQFPKWDQGWPAEREHAEPRDMGAELGNADGLDGNQGRKLGQSQRCGSHESSEAMANGYREKLNSGTDLHRLRDGNACYSRGFYRSFNWPPGPDEFDQWATVPAELRPNVESSLCRVADGLSNGLGFRREQLHALGNAVVPLQAAYAFATLAKAFE